MALKLPATNSRGLVFQTDKPSLFFAGSLAVLETEKVFICVNKLNRRWKRAEEFGFC